MDVSTSADERCTYLSRVVLRSVRAVHRMLARAFRRVRVTRRGLDGEVPETEWRAVVGQVVADLEELNRSTERDFLAVGGKLMEFYAVGHQISSDTSALAASISGEDGRNASQALFWMTDRARELSTRIAQSGQALTDVGDLSRRIRRAFSMLEETVLVFRTLCTLTRTETSRLGSEGSGFADLSDEVKPLSELIGSSGQAVLAAAVQLDGSVAASLRSGSDLSARGLKDLHTHLHNVVKELKSFEERQQRAMEVSSRQATQHAAACAAIEDLIRSIQFHDITRQQIEHVCEGLRQVLSEGRGDPRSGSQRPSEANAILALQAAQLSSAASVFASSIQRVECDLENIAGCVRDMAEASKALMGFSEEEQDSFFLRMEASFRSILQAIDACAAEEATVWSTASELEETMGGMRKALDEIRATEIQIQRTAVNATIRCTHIGEAGRAFNVIADAMQRVALDSSANTEDASSALDSMSDAVQLVFGCINSTASTGRDAADGLYREMRKAIRELHALTERSFERVKQIAALSSRLGEDIQSVRSGLSAGPLFAGVVGRARAELERIGAKGGLDGAESMEPLPGYGMDRFWKHYTMQSERDVHEAAARGKESLPVASEATLHGDRSALEDNVEFF